MDSNKNLDKEFYRHLEDFKNKKASSNNDHTNLVDYSDSSIDSNDETVKPKRIISFTKNFFYNFSAKEKVQEMELLRFVLRCGSSFMLSW